MQSDDGIAGPGRESLRDVMEQFEVTLHRRQRFTYE